MVPLFGVSKNDRAEIARAIASTGTTSLTSLAARLGWSPRYTEKLVRRLSKDRRGAIDYDPSTGTVRPLMTARPERPPIPPAALPIGPPETVPAQEAVEIARPGRAAPPAIAATCVSCRVRLVPSEVAELLVCPKCGSLERRRAPSAARPPESGSVGSGRTGVVATDGPIPERRAQELFAAYVTSGPLPCPRCRTRLRRSGPGRFRCPACGNEVRFPAVASSLSALPTTSAPAPAVGAPTSAGGSNGPPASAPRSPSSPVPRLPDLLRDGRPNLAKERALGDGGADAGDVGLRRPIGRPGGDELPQRPKGGLAAAPADRGSA